MSPGDREALQALMHRLRHVEATAHLIARDCNLPRDEGDAIAGIAATVGDAINKLDGITMAATA